MHENLLKLFQDYFGTPAETVIPLAAHASDRQIFRLKAGQQTAIGIHNKNLKENRTFIEFSRHFKKHDLPVPQIYAEEYDNGIYLEEDFGDTTLMDLLLESRRRGEGFSPGIEKLYMRALDILPRFQVLAGRDLDYRLCYPKQKYDRDSMIWDMHYFRDQLLVRLGVHFEPARLEHDLGNLADFLARADAEHFLFRDFQARNIMVQGDELFFIDYQGGRKGPLQYDVVSLLYQSRAELTDDIRSRLLDHYLSTLAGYLSFDRESFLKYYNGFVFVRIMQALGAHGLRGLGEGKRYFLDSIPHAVGALNRLLKEGRLPVDLPELSAVFVRANEMVAMNGLKRWER